MANFTPSKKTAQDFNNGVKYVDGIGDIEGDAVHAESINSVIEGQLWTQALATNPIDNSEADNVGTASIEIETMPDGTPRLKAKNLKGKQGIQGIQGVQGETGNGIASTDISYASSASGTTIPADSAWQSTIPTVAKGSYLWTRTVITYTDGTASAIYTSAYQGMDGTGSVTGVKGAVETAYRTGNVNLTPENVGAVNKSGDTMTGNLNIKAGTYSSVAVYTSNGDKTLFEKSTDITYFVCRNSDNQNKWIIYFPERSGTLALNTAESIGTSSVHSNQTDTAVEYYRNSDGSFWYRKWASGWKECGGVYTNTNSTAGNVNITFNNNFAFNDNNYTITFGAQRQDPSTGPQVKELGYLSKSPTGFTKYNPKAGYEPHTCYYCCGY